MIRGIGVSFIPQEGVIRGIGVSPVVRTVMIYLWNIPTFYGAVKLLAGDL